MNPTHENGTPSRSNAEGAVPVVYPACALSTDSHSIQAGAVIMGETP